MHDQQDSTASGSLRLIGKQYDTPCFPPRADREIPDLSEQHRQQMVQPIEEKLENFEEELTDFRCFGRTEADRPVHIRLWKGR